MGAWYYAVAGRSSHGTMRCIQCGKQITEGRYAYREKSAKGDWHYQSRHEACCLDDPAWAQMDARIERANDERKAMSRACREFREKWGVSELDEHIYEDDGHDQ